MPCKVLFGDGGSITHVYGPDGTKLRTIRNVGGTVATTDYCGNAVYENGIPKLLLTEEGYVTLPDGRYHYYLKDHQGNNRVVIAGDGTVKEVSHYYPFGGIFEGTESVQPYKYNGKELENKGGLDWYDYGARWYDAALGRWHVVDPMAENHISESLYGYCGGNPIGHVDPLGMDYWSTNDPDEITRFFNAMRDNLHSNSNPYETFNFSDWNHVTDADFLGNLTFNDESGVFYTSYGTVEGGVATRIGLIIPAVRVGEGTASVETSNGRWLRKASGQLQNVYPEFDLFFGITRGGWKLVKDIFSSMLHYSTMNTFNAGKSGFVYGQRSRQKMGKSHGNTPANHEIQNKQIEYLSKKYNLTEDERKELHDLITGEGLGFHEAEQLVKDYFNK